MIPSLSTGAVGSRFVSQNDVDTAKARRDEQWKAAYARYVTTCLCTNFFFYLKNSNTGSARNHHPSNKKTPMMDVVSLK